MKTTILLLAGTVTALSTVACNSQQPDTTMERIHSEEVATEKRTGDTPGCAPYSCKSNEYESQAWTDMDTQLVEMEQGRAAALTLELCHTDFSKPLSNRRRAECDKIVANGRRLQARRAAEEKRKDDAYDKTRPKEAK